MIDHLGYNETRKMPLAGIILAGGASSRMGENKALLEIGGFPAIARVAAAMKEAADTVTVACGRQERPEYRFLGLPQAPDAFPGLGPLAGLHAGMKASPAEWQIAAACDLPFVTARLLRHLAQQVLQERGASPERRPLAVVSVSASGRIQPLLGLYHRDVLPRLESALTDGRLKVMDWLGSLGDVLYASETGFPGWSPEAPSPLFNLNTPEDYRKAGNMEV